MTIQMSGRCLINGLTFPPGTWRIVKTISNPKTHEELAQSIAPEQREDFLKACEAMEHPQQQKEDQ